MFQKISDSIEIVIVISATDIEKNKTRADLGITYDEDVLRLRGEFQNLGFMVGSVVITHFNGQPAAEDFRQRLERDGIPTFCHYLIDGYPHNVSLIASDEGFGKNDYVKTTRPLVIVTAPGPGSGKMAVCLSQLYNENKHGVRAGYAKFETFPIWNLPLRHPVNIAYEAATADINDVNMIDPFHLEAYGKTTVNYNRDVEIFPVLNAIFESIFNRNHHRLYRIRTDNKRSFRTFKARSYFFCLHFPKRLFGRNVVMVNKLRLARYACAYGTARKRSIHKFYRKRLFLYSRIAHK